MTYDVENTGPYLGQTQTYGRVKPVNGIPILSSCQLDLDRHIQIDRQYKTCIDSLSTRKSIYTITKMNDNIHANSKIAGSRNARS